ncbi:MAG: carboxylesterase family protein [Neisseria sp.]|nr:carboxylesterase family protein [Neisseria sp.]
MKLKTTLLSALAVAALVFGGTAAAKNVQIDAGRLNGSVADGVQSYKGIPFARPPVGELRWQPPQPVAPWQGVRDATRYAAQCAQNADLGVFGKAGGSEDCLYLNVFAPEHAKAGDKLPVLVWIYGGALFVGAADDYDPTKLAREGKAVVVTPNYRVGLLGSFAHPDIDKENHPVANYGMMDQNFALDWVQRNIARFGGDPQNVTIFGESSGGQSVIAQMISPWGKDKFQHVISMSGNTLILNNREAINTLQDRQQEQGLPFAKAAGCDGTDAAACLRGLSTAQVLALQTPYLKGGVVVDGDFMPETPAAALQSGRFNRVTFINGITENEGTFFAGLPENATGNVMDKPAYAEALARTYGQNIARRIAQALPPENYPSPSEAFADAITSGWFACPAAKVNEWLSRHTPTYAYEFADPSAPSYLKPTSFPLNAAHTFELPYLFQGFHGGAGIPIQLNPQQEKLSDEMIALWTSAAQAGGSASKWQRFDPQQENYLVLTLPEAKMVNGQFRRRHHCDFWDSTGLY